jgi:predicted membrane channel-forming protein YqfA (hemolysin III family)
MKETMENHEVKDLKIQLFGWILFVVCAIFFIASSLKNGDILTFIGSIVFLIACMVFLMPLLKIIKKVENETKIDDDKKI